MQLWAIVIKELRLLSRDLHGLALLFVMPVVFIIIMSLAMKADFDRRSGLQLDVVVNDLANNEHSQSLLAKLDGNELFSLIPLDTLAFVAGNNAVNAERAVQSDNYHFLLTLHEQAFVNPDVELAAVLVAPGNSSELNQLFVAALQEAAVKENLTLTLADLEEMLPDLPVDAILQQLEAPAPFSVQYAGHEGEEQEVAPTSVQQNVPAWLVFAAFFVVVPLANTLINERQFGTLRRMRSIHVPAWKLVVGKVIPYYVINQLQVAVMLLVGVYLVPLLGGDRLTLGHSPLALVMIAAALSVAALGYGMLIAVVSRTTEQATTLGGAGNIILAALGGIMVPTFVMPEFMQEMTVISPMSWGLQGFLDVFLRGGDVAAVWPEVVSLLALGSTMLVLALIGFYRHGE